jgi:hypothetical protein
VKAFFDHNIAPHVARAVQTVVHSLGHEAVAKVDRFDPATTDVEWISVLAAERGWVVFTADKAIMKNPIERNALHASGLTAFFLNAAVRKMNTRQRNATILWHWDAIADFVPKQSHGLYWLPLNKSAVFKQVRI